MQTEIETRPEFAPQKLSNPFLKMLWVYGLPKINKEIGDLSPGLLLWVPVETFHINFTYPYQTDA